MCVLQHRSFWEGLLVVAPQCYLATFWATLRSRLLPALYMACCTRVPRYLSSLRGHPPPTTSTVACNIQQVMPIIEKFNTIGELGFWVLVQALISIQYYTSHTWVEVAGPAKLMKKVICLWHHLFLFILYWGGGGILCCEYLFLIFPLGVIISAYILDLL